MDSEEDEEGQMEAEVIGSQPAEFERCSSKSGDEMSDNSMDLSYIDSSERDLSFDLIDEGDSLAERPNPIDQRKWDDPYSYLLVRSGDELKVVGRLLDLSIPPYAPNQLQICEPEITNFNETSTVVENNERSERIENNSTEVNGLLKPDETDSEDSNFSLGSKTKLDGAESNDSSNFTRSERINQEAASSEANGLMEFTGIEPTDSKSGASGSEKIDQNHLTPIEVNSLLELTRTESDDSESIALGSEIQELLDGKIFTSPHVLNPNVEVEPENNYHLMQRYDKNNFYQKEPADYPLDDSLQLQNERHYLNLVVPSLSEISDTALEIVGPNPEHQMVAISPSTMEVNYPNQQSVPPGYMKNGQGGENVDQKEGEEGEDFFDKTLFDLNLEDEDMDQQEEVESKESSDENKSPTPESKSYKFPYDSSAGITSQAGECDLLPFGINSILSHCHRLQLSATTGENENSSAPETINNVLLENGESICNGSNSTRMIPTSELEAGLIHCSNTISEHMECAQTDEKELPNGSEHQDLSESKISLKDEQGKEEHSMNEMKVADKYLLQDLNQMEDAGCLNLQNSAANFIKSLEIKQGVEEIDQLSSEVADIKIDSSSPIQKGLLQRFSLDEELGSKDGPDLKQNDYQLKQKTIEDCARSTYPRMKPTLDDLTQGFKATGMLSVTDGGESTKKDKCDSPTASREDNLQVMSPGLATGLNTTYQAASSSANVEENDTNKAEQNGEQQEDQTSLESSYLLEKFESKNEEIIKDLTQIQTKKRKLVENVVANLKQIKTLPDLEETTMIKSVSTVASSMSALSLNMLENAPSTSKAGLGLNGGISDTSQNRTYGHLHSFFNILDKYQEICLSRDSFEPSSSSGTLGNPDTKKIFEPSTVDSLGSPPSKEVSSAAHILATLSRTSSNSGGEPVEPRPSSTQSQNSPTTSSACIVPLTSRQGVPIKRKLSEESGIPNALQKKSKLDVNKGTKTPTSSIIQNHPTSGVKAKIQRSTSLEHLVTPFIPLSAFTKGFQSLDPLPSKNGKKQSKNQFKKIGS